MPNTKLPRPYTTFDHDIELAKDGDREKGVYLLECALYCVNNDRPFPPGLKEWFAEELEKLKAATAEGGRYSLINKRGPKKTETTEEISESLMRSTN